MLSDIEAKLLVLRPVDFETPAAYFIVPVDTATVSKAVFPYKLLPLPSTDKSLFPNGFPTGKHPVVVTSGLNSDIRMMKLQLQKPLLGGSITVPYVDRLRDGKTPFCFTVKQYIGGVNNDDVNALVPSRLSPALPPSIPSGIEDMILVIGER